MDMSLDMDSKYIAGILIGIFLAVFFLAGFFANDIVMPKSSIEKAGNKTEDKGPKITGSQGTEETVSQEKALEKVKNYLAKGPFGYPFVRNVSTESINKDNRIEGTAYFYNWSISFVVEANPFNEGIYFVPENETKATKTMNFYISKNGNYFFSSSPISTEVEQKARTGGQVYP